MNDVVERVARAIDGVLEGPINNQDFARQQRQWALAQLLARAAIEAMLTPSPEMIAAGEFALSNEGVDNVVATDAIACWSGMLSAALADASPDIGKEGKSL